MPIVKPFLTLTNSTLTAVTVTNTTAFQPADQITAQFNQYLLDGYLFALYIIAMYIVYPAWCRIRQIRTGVGRDPGVPGRIPGSVESSHDIESAGGEGSGFVQLFLNSFKEIITGKFSEFDLKFNKILFDKVDHSTELYQKYHVTEKKGIDLIDITQKLILKDGSFINLADSSDSSWSQTTGFQRLTKYDDLFTVDLSARCQELDNAGQSCSVELCIDKIQDTLFAKEYKELTGFKDSGCRVKSFDFNGISELVKKIGV
ncbi:hypothetical protein WICPIJ_009456 [Wickerhamomyces pijperi]|uniref:Uncharacterized protein n=1 Tax=Wickerhamomyces pijperi TaxID=599730 RepID=A0A9P8PMD3_WICPI|nr:hypothetical protein WICPIJ_009456 [Wickerhamomyces pijperi]